MNVVGVMCFGVEYCCVVGIVVFGCDVEFYVELVVVFGIEVECVGD